MAAATNNVPQDQVSAGELTSFQIPVAASTIIYEGTMVSISSTGYAVPTTSSTGPVAGIAEATTDNSAGTDGAINTIVRLGAFWRPNHATHTLDISYVGKPCYASDNNTLSSYSSDGPFAGIVAAVDLAMGVLCVFDLAALTLSAQAASTNFVAAPLGGAILAAGTPMAAFADNAGASAPGVSLVNSKAFGIRWNNYATQTPVYTGFNLPADIDLTAPITVKVRCSKVGATGTDLTTFDVAIYPQTTGALHDAGTNAAGTTGAISNLATKTVQEVSVTVTAANLGVAGDPVTLSIQPTNGTLGTDDMVVHAVRLVYKMKKPIA